MLPSSTAQSSASAVSARGGGGEPASDDWDDGDEADAQLDALYAAAEGEEELESLALPWGGAMAWEQEGGESSNEDEEGGEAEESVGALAPTSPSWSAEEKGQLEEGEEEEEEEGGSVWLEELAAAGGVHSEPPLTGVAGPVVAADADGGGDEPLVAADDALGPQVQDEWLLGIAAQQPLGEEEAELLLAPMVPWGQGPSIAGASRDGAAATGAAAARSAEGWLRQVRQAQSLEQLAELLLAPAPEPGGAGGPSPGDTGDGAAQAGARARRQRTALSPAQVVVVAAAWARLFRNLSTPRAARAAAAAARRKRRHEQQKSQRGTTVPRYPAESDGGQGGRRAAGPDLPTPDAAEEAAAATIKRWQEHPAAAALLRGVRERCDALTPAQAAAVLHALVQGELAEPLVIGVLLRRMLAAPAQACPASAACNVVWALGSLAAGRTGAAARGAEQLPGPPSLAEVVPAEVEDLAHRFVAAFVGCFAAPADADALLPTPTPASTASAPDYSARRPAASASDGDATLDAAGSDALWALDAAELARALVGLARLRQPPGRLVRFVGRSLLDGRRIPDMEVRDMAAMAWALATLAGAGQLRPGDEEVLELVDGLAREATLRCAEIIPLGVQLFYCDVWGLKEQQDAAAAAAGNASGGEAAGAAAWSSGGAQPPSRPPTAGATPPQQAPEGGRRPPPFGGRGPRGWGGVGLPISQIERLATGRKVSNTPLNLVEYDESLTDSGVPLPEPLDTNVMTARDAALLVWATAEVGYHNPAFVRAALEAYGDAWPTCLGMYELARLVAGLGRHGTYPRTFVDKVVNFLYNEAVLPRAQAATILLLSEGFARMGHAPGASFQWELQKAACEEWTRYAPDEAPRLALAFTAMWQQYTPLHACLARDVGRYLGGMSPTGLGDLAQAFKGYTGGDEDPEEDVADTHALWPVLLPHLAQQLPALLDEAPELWRLLDGLQPHALDLSGVLSALEAHAAAPPPGQRRAPQARGASGVGVGGSADAGGLQALLARLPAPIVQQLVCALPHSPGASDALARALASQTAANSGSLTAPDLLSALSSLHRVLRSNMQLRTAPDAIVGEAGASLPAAGAPGVLEGDAAAQLAARAAGCAEQWGFVRALDAAGMLRDLGAAPAQLMALLAWLGAAAGSLAATDVPAGAPTKLLALAAGVGATLSPAALEAMLRAAEAQAAHMQGAELLVDLLEALAALQLPRQPLLLLLLKRLSEEARMLGAEDAGRVARACTLLGQTVPVAVARKHGV